MIGVIGIECIRSHASPVELHSDAHSVASRELELADEYRLEFVKPHANVHRAAALCGLREFKQSITLLEDIRKSCKDHHFIPMNIGTVLARIYLALGSPDRALRALEEHLGAESTPGMDAEFEACGVSSLRVWVVLRRPQNEPRWQLQ